MSGGTLAGIIVGTIIGTAILVAIAAFVGYRRCIRDKNDGDSEHREMKGRGIARGDIDLASQYSGQEGVIMPDPNDTIYPGGGRRDSRGSHFRLARTRATSDDGDLHDASTISPFWDGNRVSQSQYTLDVDLGPPLSAHQSRGTSFPSSPDSPSFHSPSFPLIPQSNNGDARSTYPSSGTPSHRPSGSMGNMTKAHLASSFVANNPDQTRDRNLGDLGDQGATPPMNAPLGGFVREQDAGRIGAGENDTEHLPPMYDPEWQTQARGGRRE